ncbi:MAG: SIMPL domain-containing protein [Oricola sp.]|jgi:uncharacterized protein YggE|nr:SIMPL domain-containing protein [Oricola sp.]
MRSVLAAAILAVFAQSSAAANEEPRSISVSATHKLDLKPTEATVTVLMQHEADSAEAVEAMRAAGAAAIRQALAAEGRKVIEIRDENIRMNTRTKTQRVYEPDGKYENVEATTYSLSGGLKVVSDVDDRPLPLSPLLLVEGVSQVSNPVYRAYVSDDVIAKARERSLEEATAKAREIARSYGLKLGKPSRINVSDNIRQGIIEGGEPGQLSVQATVNLTFDLLE